ncbi:two-component sensor histidine kinase [Streptomyces sp. Ru73]|uniref:sensor histidine kinase n=1 Tax=Streptomyces sp. Ru73 TaxID=2080748 RepID=UPI000CDD6C30|nr:ATP-binding protein [Streptomyces sp. Ru73]POX42521.1 two-component sensor histidine kinase [Streptomyces sp. Ru73]
MNHFFGDRPRLRQAVRCLVAGLLLTGLVLEGLDTGSVPLAAAWVASGGLALAALAVPRHRFTPAALAAVTASCLVTLVNTQLAQRAEVTYGFLETCALLLLIARALWQRPLLPASLVAAGATAATTVIFLRLSAEQWSTVADFVLPATWFGALLMVALGLYLRLLDTLRAREHEAGLQEQRLEYARELHDFVAHHVTAIIAQTKAVRFASAAGNAPEPAELDRMLAGIEQAGSQAMDSMRSMVSVLRDPVRPAATRPAGDLGGLRELAAGFSAAGPAATLTLDPRLADRGLPPGIGTTVLHVVREALTNVRKHAHGATGVTIDVRLHEDGTERRLRVAVTDDGRGRPAPGERRVTTDRDAHGQTVRDGRRPGFGLMGLAERAEALGGRLTAGRVAGGGWTVGADLPLPPASAEARTDEPLRP